LLLWDSIVIVRVFACDVLKILRSMWYNFSSRE
jgi:hypothetical protein